MCFRSNRSWLLVVLFTAVAVFSTCANQPSKPVSLLRHYIMENFKTPEDYVVSCFKDHDIVFVGEYHRIKHDPLLVQHLIPRLYKIGVYNLGIEFANRDDQPLIDSLLAAPEYDQALANKIQFDQWPFWGFKEYVDLYKVAWELNHSLAADAPKFRIVGLNAKTDWSYVWTEADRKNPDVMRKVFAEGDGDALMANTISVEFVSKGKKALIYSGINHAYTKYKQPVYDVANDSLIRFADSRMGNLVYREIGDRAMTIFLHSPWPSEEGYDKSVRPADGMIDKVFEGLDSNYYPCGFDVAGSPFGKLAGETGYWKHGYPGFTLADYCDGYIYTKPLGEYEGCTVIENFINEGNRLQAIAQSANPRTKDSSRTAAELMQSLHNDTDFGRRFAEFK